MTKTILVPDDHTLHDHEAIYLEPKCQGQKWGRHWAENNAWGECDCGLSHSSVKYIRADLAAPKPTIPEDDRIAAIHAGCSAADIHLKCSFPDCSCETTPREIDAAMHTLISLGWKK